MRSTARSCGKYSSQGKAFNISELDAEALLHNLTDSDYERPLDEIRDLFWSAPRMPILPGGDSDPQRAIFQALQAGTIRLVCADGIDRVVTRPGEIGVGQSSLRLAKPKASDGAAGGTGGDSGAHAGDSGAGSGSSGSGTSGAGSGRGSTTGTQESGGGAGGENAAAGEQELAFTLMTSLTDDLKRDSVRLLLRDLANAIDEGKASYAQLMVKVIVDTSVADGIAEDIRAAGTTPTIKKV